MISKEKLKEEIDKFPEDEISIDELIERLVFIEKLEHRISSSKQNGAKLTEDEMRNEIGKWSK